MSLASDDLITERPADGVLVLRLNRPDKRNALATDLLAQVADALDAVRDDPAARCVILTGSERVFAAGADIHELASKDVDGALSDPRPAIWGRIRSFPKPLLAAVEGWCLGAGNELAMCCDLVIAGEAAKFGQPETNLGIIPGAGGTAILPRLVGRSAAMRMVLLGEPITAEQARAMGFVSEVTADGGALAMALELAGKISARAPLAMRQAKALVAGAFDMGQTAHLALERQAFAALFGTADRREGVSAFIEKRSAGWTGR